MYNFSSKIVGTTFIDGGQDRIGKLKSNDVLILKREKDNKFDCNAISVYHDKDKLGFISSDTAKGIVNSIDSGIEVSCFVVKITGGSNSSYGCNISITVND